MQLVKGAFAINITIQFIPLLSSRLFLSMNS